MTYREGCEREFAKGTGYEKVLADFWDGKLYERLKNDGMFEETTDLGFAFFTDGVEVFKQRRSHTVWPLVLVNLSLPPAERVLKHNVLLVGVIPGPTAPDDLHSFLFPMICEFIKLDVGIPDVYNGHTKEHFTLRAYITMVCGDTKARESLMGMSGCGAYLYCSYCSAHGYYGCNKVYCPFKAPKFNKDGSPKDQEILPDPDPDDPESEEYNKRYDDGGEPKHFELDAGGLPLRNHYGMKAAMDNLTLNLDVAVTKKLTGINDASVFICLRSIYFPFSFPIDAMHLWFINISKMIFNHLRGNFNTNSKAGKEEVARKEEERAAKRQKTSNNLQPNPPPPDPADSSDEETHSRLFGEASDSEEMAIPEKETGKRKRGKKNKKQDKPRVPSKFNDTDDRYNIPKAEWYKMGNDMRKTKLRGYIPTVFGTNIRSVADHFHDWNAEEWRYWLLRYFPIYGKGRLPDDIYDEIISFIKAVSLCTKVSISVCEMMEVRARLLRWTRFYESEFYQFKEENVRYCLPTFHTVAHVYDCLEQCGPMFSYASWVTERFCGMLSHRTKSKVQTNKNMSLNMLLDEQLRHFEYTVSLASVPIPSEWMDRQEDLAALLNESTQLRLLRSSVFGSSASRRSPYDAYNIWQDYAAALHKPVLDNTEDDSSDDTDEPGSRRDRYRSSTAPGTVAPSHNVDPSDAVLQKGGIIPKANGKGNIVPIDDKMKASLKETWPARWSNMRDVAWRFVQARAFSTVSFIAREEAYPGQKNPSVIRETRVASSRVKQGTWIRSASFVLFETEEGLQFGEVQYFFQLEVNTRQLKKDGFAEADANRFVNLEHEKDKLYAHIQILETEEDGPVTWIKKDGAFVTVEASAVEELVGLIVNNKRIYLTYSLNSLSELTLVEQAEDYRIFWRFSLRDSDLIEIDELFSRKLREEELYDGGV